MRHVENQEILQRSQYLKKIILEEFPYFKESEVEKALEKYCDRVRAPRPRKKYLECLQDILGGEW